MTVWRVLPLLALTGFVVGCESTDVPRQTREANPAPIQSASPPLVALAPALPALSRGRLIPGLDVVAESTIPIPHRDPYGLKRVGLLLPLTGPAADVGQSLLNAAQMALFDVGDDRFVLQPYDTAGTPDGAVDAAALAVAHGAQVLLGPVFSASAKAVVPQAQAAGINMIPFTTDPTVAAPGVFVVGFLAHEQVRRIITFGRAQGIERFAVLAPATPYGETVVDAMSQVVAQTGGSLNRVAYYDQSGEGLSDVVRSFADYDRRHNALLAQRAALESRTDTVSRVALRRLQRLDTIGEVPFDAVLIPAQGARLTEVAALLPFYDIDPGRVQLLGTMMWHGPGLGKEPALVGGWYPAPSPEGNAGFYSRYRTLYGTTPPAIATHGYDAVALAAVLGRTRPDRTFASDALASPSGFSGVDGVFRLLPTGLSERGFAIMEITRDGSEAIDPAPTTFEASQF
ncbi:MAG: penicillin-binding protein activator [Rhodospirillaceae bacterium]|nr:penicillin-binding protein activator [Rhodospirillaceae bacterium]